MASNLTNQTNSVLTEETSYHQQILELLSPTIDLSKVTLRQKIARQRFDMLKSLLSPTPKLARVRTKLNFAEVEKFDDCLSSEESDEQTLLKISDVALNSRILACTGEFVEAMKLCQSLLSTNSDDPRAHCAIADVLRLEGKNEEALKQLEKNFDDKDPIALRIKGNLLYELGRKAEAKDFYDRAINLDPSFCHALRGRAEVLSDLQPSESILVDLNNALEWEPRNPFTLAIRGKIHHQLGHHQSAIRDYQSAIDKFQILHNDHAKSPLFMKNYCNARLNLAKVYLEMNLKTEAQYQVKLILQDNENHQETLTFIAVLNADSTD